MTRDIESVRNRRAITALTAAGRDYAAAYSTHYTARSLPEALQLYVKLVASHPGSEEAGYSRTQAQNIINATVPDQVLLDAQVALAVEHFAKDAPPSGMRPPSA
jgi:hypothetical protein